MNAVMYWWNFCWWFKASLGRVPDMKGLNWLLSLGPIFFYGENKI
jgi:hypothetical protein